MVDRDVVLAEIAIIQHLSDDVLKHILVERLGDFEEFSNQVIRFAQRPS